MILFILFLSIYYSAYAAYLISYRPPRRVIEEYGYHVEFMHKFGTTMTGNYIDFIEFCVVLLNNNNDAMCSFVYN